VCSHSIIPIYPHQSQRFVGARKVFGRRRVDTWGRFIGIENEDIHILKELFECGDHTLQRGVHGSVRLVWIRTRRFR
jgi:hypothetical protein